MLPLISVPLIIHLLNRRNLRVVDFSTLHFLKKMEHESIRKLKILQILLLIIRTIMILLIVLMMARPVVKGVFSWLNDEESTVVAILVDDTFSTSGNAGETDRDKLKETAVNSLISHIADGTEIILSSLSSGVLYNGLRKDIPPGVINRYSAYTGGNVEDRLIEILEKVHRDYVNKELFIITDGQTSNFTLSDSENKLLPGWNIIWFDLADPVSNLAVTNVKLLNEIPLTDTPVKIEVSVKNTGEEGMDNALLQFSVNDIGVGQQIISLPSGKEGKFSFSTAFHEAGVKHGIVNLQNDDRPGDNRFYFLLNIPEETHIALASESPQDLLFIRNAITALNKDKDLFILKQFSGEEFKYTLDLRDIDVLVIQGVDDFPPRVQEKLTDFLKDGGHIILFPGIHSQKMPDLTAIGVPAIDGARKDLPDGAFQVMDYTGFRWDEFGSIFRAEEGNPFRLFAYIPLPVGENSMMMLQEGSAIWNRYESGRGVVDVFGMAMDLTWTNLPIRGGFIPFWHRLLFSTLNRDNVLIRDTDSPWDVKVTDVRSDDAINHLSPDGVTTILERDGKGMVTVDRLLIPGYHKILSRGDVLYETAVNIPESELTYPSLTEEQARYLFDGDMQFIESVESLRSALQSAGTGMELWKWFLVLFVFLIIVEMYLSNVYGAKKR